MSLTDRINGLRGVNFETLVGLRPPYPPIVVNIDQDEALLVRLKPRRRGLPLLEAHRSSSLADMPVPASIFQPVTLPVDALAARLRELFETTGTRPGRVALVLPDNLAKISLLQLPERPASSRQLDELVRAKMRRSVPFRLEDTSLSYQVLPGEGREVAVLVVLLRRVMVERLEAALESLGARAGLVDICTPNLINLCRDELAEASGGGADAALLNCCGNYFSLVIVRGGRLIFFRCKTYSLSNGARGGAHASLVREVGNSLSYYREKLAGTGVKTVFVRTTHLPYDEIATTLRGFGCERVERVDAARAVDLAEGLALDAEAAQRLAPAIAAAGGRGR